MLKEVGYLSIRVGPMRSGKTHWLVSHATRYADIGESVVYINSVLDDPDIRKSAGGDGVNYTSHSSSNKSISSLVTNVKVSNLSQCDIDNYNVICVDEGQFYSDLYDTVLEWVLEKNKHVLVVSLDGSYRQKLIGDVTKLLPISNEFEKMSAICMKCIKERPEVSHRFKHCDANVTILESQTSDDSSDILPGMTESYCSVCTYHLINK